MVVLLFAVIAGLGNRWWVNEFRDLGAYTVDEAGYIATGMRFERKLDPLRPWILVIEVLAPASTGPLVPVLSVPVLVTGERTVETAMITQSVVAGVAAICAAGVAGRISGKGAALVSGVVVLLLPATILSARSYQFALALAACMLGALWALLVSDRGHRRGPMVLFGAAVGAMVLARPMSVAFLPGMALGALLVVRKDRKAWTNLGLAAITVAAVTGPWLLRSGGVLASYLQRFGYGDRARAYGSGAGSSARLGAIVADVGWPLVVVGLLAASAVVVNVIKRSRAGHGRARSPEVTASMAVFVVVLSGYLALLTTSNQGVWFELPLEVLAVTGVVAVAARVGGWQPRLLGVAALLVAVVTFSVSLMDGGAPSQGPGGARSSIIFEGYAARSPFPRADPTFADADRTERAGAAARWWTISELVVAELDGLRGDRGPLAVVVSGSSELFNVNTLLLAHELSSLETPWVQVPDTTAPAEEWAPLLAPEFEGRDRVLVIAAPRSTPFPADRRVADFAGEAVGEGWRVRRRLPLPDGGSVSVWIHVGAT